MKIAIVQNMPGFNKTQNLQEIRNLIPKEEFNILVLPECFNSPYGTQYFKEYAENISKLEGETIKFLHELSIEYNTCCIIAGSIPEKFGRDDNFKYYNTCTIWKNGQLIDRYRKMHLFDVLDSNGNYVFKESSVLSRGKSPTIVKTPWGNIGIGICFDLRFNELSNYYKKNDCKVIFYPGNFTEWSGSKHWQLLLRSRALDTQCFVVGCSTALNNDMEYKSYGHSLVVNPWGEVLREFSNDINSDIVSIDLNIVNQVKKRIPINNIISI